ncbi:response regulator [Penaeicola halotolerans]|uniref:response regulator n=1 Tax=Penaeicola halotolerans TaxID=2793196 RepID=UPI001CF90F88|nr:response regulator [Penaeicola halotolerans]
MKPIHILLVEDNEGDLLLTTEALNEGKITNQISIVRDGSEALRFLKKEAEYNDASLPDLILLDVNLPKLNGHEVLKAIKTDDKLKTIPVIMLTTSSSESDIIKSYENYANCYISKPIEVQDFMDVVTSIENFWVSLVKLPSQV